MSGTIQTTSPLLGRADTPFDRLYLFFGSPKNDEAATLSHLNVLLHQERAFDGATIDIDRKDRQMFGVALTDQTISEVATFWNTPDGDFSAMCHDPHHGLATFTNGVFDWYASICFICHSAVLYGAQANLSQRMLWHGQFPLGENERRRSFEARLNGLLPAEINKDRFWAPRLPH